MATQTKLGRVQGAGVFIAKVDAYAGATYQYISRSDITPSAQDGIKPMVGDTIIFANGVVAVIDNVQSSSSVGCQTNLFSLKGKDGLNITKIEQTTVSDQSGGTNVVTFTLSDGKRYNVQIKNGKEGGIGIDGIVAVEQNNQNKLYLTKQGQLFGDGVVLPQGGGAGGTNYIANSNFAINQRGKQSYNEQGNGRTYTLDRWAKNSATGNLVVEQLQTNPADCVVPSDGSVIDKLYFNTSASAQQVLQIITEANLPFVSGFFDMPVYPVCLANNVGVFILQGEGNYLIGWQNMETNQSGVIYSSYSGEWAEQSLTVGGATVDTLMGIAIGTHNDKLADIISVANIFDSAQKERVRLSGSIAGTGEVFVQPVEGALVAGKKITFSMNMPTLVGECMFGVVAKTAGGHLQACIPAQQGKNVVSCVVAPNATQVVCGLFNNGQTQADFLATIAWAKLEVGDNATEYLEPLPASDMAECQRYFQKTDYNGAVGYAKDQSTLETTLFLPTTMRKTPAVNSDEKMYVKNAHAMATANVIKAGNNCVCLSFATQNLIANNFYVLNDYTGFFDAEIYENE